MEYSCYKENPAIRSTI